MWQRCDVIKDHRHMCWECLKTWLYCIKCHWVTAIVSTTSIKFDSFNKNTFIVTAVSHRTATCWSLTTFGNVRMCDVIMNRIVCKYFSILVKYQLFTVMPRVCSAWNCKNKDKCGKGLYRFPTDDRIRAEWAKRVSGGRGNWKLRSLFRSFTCTAQQPSL